MSSSRQLIREDVVARLKSAVSEVSDRVFKARAESLGEIEVPCICVYTRDEETQTLSSQPTIQNRKLNLAVEIIVSGTNEIDDELDALADKVEVEMLKCSAQAPASGLYSSVELSKTEMGFIDLGRKPTGAARLTFEFSYEKTYS